jgi:hypothetical protein
MNDRNLALEVVRITEAAALASARLMGRGDRMLADHVAVEAMRRAFDTIDIRGTVVIGEGERDEAPMLYIGERVGAGWLDNDADSPKVDIAVDPLEGTNLCATGAPDAISVIAIADDGQFLNAPDTYMQKIAVGPDCRGVIDLRESPDLEPRAHRQGQGQEARRAHRGHPRARSPLRAHRRGPRRPAPASASSATATSRRGDDRAATTPASTCCSAPAARPRA